MEILLEEQELILEFYPRGSYVVELWNGFTSDKRFAELLDKLLNICEARNVKGLVIDAREHKGLSPVSQKLAATKMEGYARKIGLLRQAIMIPKDVFSKFSVENYSKELEKTPGHIETKFFDELDQAKLWLENVSQQKPVS